MDKRVMFTKAISLIPPIREELKFSVMKFGNLKYSMLIIVKIMPTMTC